MPPKAVSWALTSPRPNNVHGSSVQASQEPMPAPFFLDSASGTFLFYVGLQSWEVFFPQLPQNFAPAASAVPQLTQNLEPGWAAGLTDGTAGVSDAVFGGGLLFNCSTMPATNLFSATPKTLPPTSCSTFISWPWLKCPQGVETPPPFTSKVWLCARDFDATIARVSTLTNRPETWRSYVIPPFPRFIPKPLKPILLSPPPLTTR